MSEESRKMAKLAVEALDDKKAEDMLKNAFDGVGIALEYRDFKSDTKFWD